MAKCSDLDRIVKKRTADRENMLGKVAAFPRMLDESLGMFAGFRMGARWPFREVVISGMGGSAICGDIIQSILEEKNKVRITVNRGYSIPASVDRHSLFIAISYSGNTEETLACLGEAQSRGLSIVAISSDGELTAIAKRMKYPTIALPGGLPPRAALPYILGAVMTVLDRAGVARALSQVKEAVNILDKLSREYTSNAESNFARQVAVELNGKFPLVLASNGLTAAAGRRFCAQLNENGKTLAHLSVLPEMNHNEIVGLEGRTIRKKDLCVIVLRDESQGERIQKRIEITRGLIRPLAACVKEVWPAGRNPLSRALSLVLFGDFVSVYLAMLGGHDPTEIRSIDTLKKELSR